jgi:LacI family transcriptional regulator
MKPTIRNIAEVAGVSRGTVDKVLNNRIGVSDRVRAHVKLIAKELGYRPNPAGKALAFQKKPLCFGFILLMPADSIFKTLRHGAEAAGAEFANFGLKLEFAIMARITPEEQLRCIDQLEKRGMSGLILSPLQDRRIEKAVTRLNRDGVPVITANTDLPDSKRMCFVGQDLVASGRVAGELMGRLLSAGRKIGILSGSASIEALKERIRGFQEVLAERYQHLEIVQIEEGVEDDDAGFAKTKAICRNHPDLDGLYITGRGIRGACEALKALKFDRVRVVCFDAQPETGELLREGRVDFTITQDPYQQGYLPIKLLYEYFFMNRKPENTIYHTQLRIMTSENWQAEK